MRLQTEAPMPNLVATASQGSDRGRDFPNDFT